MKSINIQAEEELIAALEKLAEAKAVPIDGIVKEALRAYLQKESAQPKTYSFIGIGRSGKKNLSTQVDEALKEAANRREGWSLSE